METTQIKPLTKMYLSFSKNTEIEKLITFSQYYLEVVVPSLIQYINNNEGKFISLDFTRIQEDGTLQEPKSYIGVTSKFENNSFVFRTNHHISMFDETDDLIENVIRTDNVLGVIPIMPNTEIKKILQRNKNEVSKEYFYFLSQVRRILKTTLGLEHYVELCFNNFVIKCEILEVNKSNIKIFQKILHSTKKDQYGKYLYVNIIPQEKFILFLEKEDALLSMNINFGYSLNINPHDDED